MKKSILFLCAILMIATMFASPAYYSNRILFSLDANEDLLTKEQMLALETPYSELNKLIKKFDIVKIEPWLSNATEKDRDGDVYLNRIYRLTMSTDTKAPFVAAGEIANSSASVMNAEPEPIMRKLAVPDDPMTGNQWYLYKAQVQEAWSLWDIEGGEIPGNKNIVVAVVDDGVEYTHPDLWKNIWINQDEIPSDYFAYLDVDSDGWVTAEEAVAIVGDISGNGEADLKDVISSNSFFINGQDDDGDGYIDNIIGWDTDAVGGSSDDDRDPMVKDNDHGTHVAGLVGATTNNSTGIASAAYNISIMPVKATGDETVLSINTGWDGIQYAAQAGADIINCSWGGPGFSSYAQNIANNVYNNYGAIIIAAAGNGADSENNIEQDDPHYPSGYDNVVSVTAVGSQDNFSWASYGEASGNFYGVDISAPGETMLSTVLTKAGSYGYKMGTSMASPFAASCLALLKFAFPDSSNDWLIDRLVTNTDPIDDLNPNYAGKIGSGRVNILKALTSDKWPKLSIQGQMVNIVSGDGDTVLNPGESINIMLDLENAPGWSDASNIIGVLRSDVAGVNVVDSLATWASIPENTIALNDGNGFEVSFSDLLTPGDYEFELLLESATDETFAYSFTCTFTISLSLEMEGFPFEALTEVEASPLFADIDDDGDQEIFFGDILGNIYAVDHSGDTLPGFPVSLGTQVNGLAIADIDLDDTLEIAATGFDKLVSVYDVYGNYEWSRHTNILFITAFPVIGNLDDDPELEVVVGSYDQNLYAFNHDSTDVTGFPYALGQPLHSAVSLADLNADGKDDIIFVSKNGRLGVLNSDASMMSGFPLDIGGSVISGPQTVVTGDSSAIIIWGTETGDMYGYDLNGNQRFMIDGDGKIKASPALCDYAESLYAFFATSQGDIYKIDLLGDSVATGWPVTVNSINRSLVVADVLADNSVEPHVLAMGSNGNIYALDMMGESVPGFPINTKYLSKSSLAVTDIDDDNDIDLITGNYSGISVTDLKDLAQEVKWPMHRGSLDRKGSITYVMTSTQDNILPSKFELLGNYPNPFNPSTKIKFRVAQESPIELKIYSLDGKLSMARRITASSAGEYEISLNMSNYSSGIYFYTLEQDGLVRSSKMILLK